MSFKVEMKGTSWARVCGMPWEEMLALMITEVPRISESRMWARMPPSSGVRRSIMSLPYGEWWAPHNKSLVMIVVLPRAPRPLKRQDTGKDSTSLSSSSAICLVGILYISFYKILSGSKRLGPGKWNAN